MKSKDIIAAIKKVKKQRESIKKLSIVRWIGNSDNNDIFNGCSRYIYHGEIPNMRGHCVVSDMDTGKLYSGYHISDFVAVVDE